VIIRPATPDDLPCIRELEQQSETAAHWSEREYTALFSPEAARRVVLVAAEGEAAQSILGFAVAHCGSEEWEIENVVVAKRRRRSGTGSLLVRKILQEAAQAGAAAMLLEVREANHAARKLYETLGFIEIARRQAYYHNPAEDALVLKISIAVP
jgi:ribosomal-protein-alanine acetyltransferase